MMNRLPVLSLRSVTYFVVLGKCSAVFNKTNIPQLTLVAVVRLFSPLFFSKDVKHKKISILTPRLLFVLTINTKSLCFTGSANE